MTLNLNAKFGKSAEKAMIAGGVVAVVAMAAASANPNVSMIANSLTAAGVTVAATGLVFSMFNSLRLAD